MAVAVVLDPRYKLQCVNWGCMRIYGQHSVEYELEFSMVKDALRRLYEAYEFSHSSSSKAIPTTNASNAANEASDHFMMDFDSFSMEQSSVAIKSKIDMYYEEPLIPRGTNLDILSYWRTCSVRYPILAKIAKDVLVVLVSTVASESTFSTGSRVLDCYRTNMDPQMEMLCGSVMKLKVGNNDDTPHTLPELEQFDENASSNIV
uniref:HAT C-terminal dimerisation domain-containing protein n=1 Tax=Chenopodium quinoa TaxID=63459 RepID=A0A803KMV6_CHEQI